MNRRRLLLASLPLTLALALAFFVWMQSDERKAPTPEPERMPPAIADSTSPSEHDSTLEIIGERGAVEVEHPQVEEREGESVEILVHVVSRLDGAPLVGATVRSYSSEDMTGADGTARLAFSGPLGRKLWIEATAAGHLPALAWMAKGEREVEVALWPGVDLRVRVIDASLHAPRAGAEVRVLQSWGEGDADACVQRCTTDETGGTTPCVVRPGIEFSVDVAVSGCRALFERHALEIAGVLELAVCADGILSGTVLDSQGDPQADVVVTVETDVIGGIWGQPRDVTDAAGRFQLGGLTLPGAYQLEVRAPPTWFAFSEPLLLDAAQPTREVTLRLEGARERIGVHVTGDDGEPLEGAIVRLELSNTTTPEFPTSLLEPPLVSSGETDAQGVGRGLSRGARRVSGERRSRWARRSFARGVGRSGRERRGRTLAA